MKNCEIFVNIKTFRLDSGWSQVELAKRCGVTSACINKIESGKSVPSLPVIAKIAKVFSVSVSKLIGETELSDDEILVSLKSFYIEWSLLSKASKEDKEFLGAMINRLISP